MRNYQRAVALNPALEPAYVNLGEVLEDFYLYEEAATQYRQAIVADRKDAIPYNNLARVLLTQGKSLTALRIAEDGLAENPDSQTAATLLKNKAWAEYELGFYFQSIQDAKNLKTAAGDCILGKAYTKMGRKPEARAAWAMFRQENKTAPGTASAVQPDCQLLAEDSAGGQE
jgi:tetratricopeptide (TPR) repeat protein